MKAWIDGKFVRWDKIVVSPLSHSFSRGSAIFEVVDIVQTTCSLLGKSKKSGSAFFGLTAHIDRFYNSARLSYMDIPIQKEALSDALIKTARKNGITAGVAKFFAYYSAIEFNITPKDRTVTIAIFCFDFGRTGLDVRLLPRPVNAVISPLKKIPADAVPVHAKVSGSYINSYIAKMDAKRRGFGEVILLDDKGFVAEGATSNIFFVKKNTIMTPSLDSALPGVTRKVIIQLARDLGYELKETNILPSDLPSFNEAFYSGSVVHIQPIREIDGTAVGSACPGTVTASLEKEMGRLLSGENETYHPLLTPIT